MAVHHIKKCILIRHGATEGNKQKRYIGCRTDEGLSQEGIDSCLALREHITKLVQNETVIHPGSTCENYDEYYAGHINEAVYLYSSPMNRSCETAELLFPELSICRIDELREMDFGCFEGHNYEELNGNPDYQRFLDSGGKAQIPGGESRDEFIKRSLQGFYTAICNDYHSLPPGNAVCNSERQAVLNASHNAFRNTDSSDISIIVCHGGNIMAIMSSLTGGDYYDFQVANLDGYILDFTLNDENISDLTYNRISDRLHS